MRYIILFIALLFTFEATAQTDIVTRGKFIDYDTTGTFALTTLAGNKGMLKVVGYIDMIQGLEKADSLQLFVTFSDSVECAFILQPISKDVSISKADTTGRSTPVAQHLWYIRNGAGNVTIPWFRLREGGSVTDLTMGATRFAVLVWINKVAGLHTYGTTSTGKAAGKMGIQVGLHR